MSRTLLILVLCTPLAAQEKTTLQVPNAWIGAVALNRDGTQLFVGSSNGHIEGYLTLSPPWLIPTIRTPRSAIAAFALSSEGRLAVGHQGSGALLYDPRVPHVLRGHKGGVLSVAFFAEKLLATGSIDGTLRLWDVKTVKEVALLIGHKSWVNGVVFDPSGDTLYSAGSDNSVRVWAVKTRKLEYTFSVKEGEVRAVAISPDGKRLAAGIRYGGVRVWDLATKKALASLRAHEGETWVVAFTPDGKSLLSGGGDWNKPGEVRLWDTTTWKETASLKHPGEVLCFALSSDGKTLAAGGGEGTVKVWDLTAVRTKP